MSRRLAVVFLIPIVLIAACSGGGDDAASSTTFAPPLTNPPLPTTATTTESTAGSTTIQSTAPETTEGTSVSTTDPPTSSSSTVTTTTDPTTTSTTEPDEFDWVAIVQDLSDALVDLQLAPDVDRVEDYCLPDENPCQESEGETIRLLAEEGWRAVDLPRSEVISATLNATQGDLPIGEALFVVVLVEFAPIDLSDARVVDSEGDVMFDLSDDQPALGARVNWVMARDAAGEWKVFETMGLG